MSRRLTAGLIVWAWVTVMQIGISPEAAVADMSNLRVVSEETAGGFAFPESAAYDPDAKVLYVSQFGGTELKPAEKDGKGKISKVSLSGKILEEQFLPTPGETLNKPKGIWVKGDRLWVTDIDSVWVFDLKTKEGKKLELPGITFANDVTVMGNALYVSDNRSDQLVRVEPADFLKAKTAPKITVVFKGKGVFPNGLYPGKNGALLMVGFESKEKLHGIFQLALGHDEPTLLSDNIGMLDGLYRMSDGDILATDWVSGSLFQWNKKMGKKDLATGFKGPADFCAFPNNKGLLVVVPDLVKGELRFVQFGK